MPRRRRGRDSAWPASVAGSALRSPRLLDRRAEPRPAADDLERLGRQLGERPSGRDVVRPADVDRVVALVHPGRLEVVRGVRQRRMDEHVARPVDADLAGAEMLVAIDPRAELGLRVVEVDHDQPVEADPGVEVGQEGVDRRRVADIDPGRPGVRRRRGRSRSGRRPLRLADASAMAASSATSCRARSRSRREFSSTIIGRGIAALASVPSTSASDQREAVGEPLRCPPCTPAAAMRADVDVDEARREPGRGPQVAGQDADRAREEVLLGTGQVDEVRGVDRDRIGCRAPTSRSRKAGPSAGRRRAAPPGGRVVGEHLERVGADLVRPVDRLDHAAAERQVGAEASSVGKHPRHGTTCGAPCLAGPVVRARAGLAPTPTMRAPCAGGRGRGPSCTRRRRRARSGRSRRRRAGTGWRPARSRRSRTRRTGGRAPPSGARASSSNMGSIAKRFDLDDPALARRTLGAVGEPAEDLLLLLGPGPQARLLLVVDRLPLDLVDDVVERLLVARAGGAAAQRMAVDDEGDLGEVGSPRRSGAARSRARPWRRCDRRAAARSA